jgi:hypothetical protein
MSYKRQPILRLSLLDKKLLRPGKPLHSRLRQGELLKGVAKGIYLRKDYKYLEDIILRWREDTISVFVKALPNQAIPSLELRVREFQPSKAFKPDVIASVYDDDHGWMPNPPVRTKPFAIPYTHYVECGRLEVWAKESYRWKLRWTQHRPGRSLLAFVGLQDVPLLTSVSCIIQPFPKTLHTLCCEAYWPIA